MVRSPAAPLLAVLPLLIAACATTTSRRGLPPLAPVAALDVGRYMGTWYEIARFPERFQAGCFGSAATYTRQEDGTIEVVNACHRDAPDGPLDTVRGRARQPDPARPAELQVSFFWPFWADYWVIALDPDYRFAAVGHPSRDHLWILSRTPSLPPGTEGPLWAQLAGMGYELGRLERTEPAAATPPAGH